MNDPFPARVRAAAVAGWWTVLFAVIFTALLWTAYRIIMASHPAWVLSMWGPDITWSEMQRMFLWIIIAFRFVVWLLILLVLWLTLWARQLKKQSSIP